jgi:hypothetical protein
MATASRSLATALWGARFASGLLRLSYTTPRDTTSATASAGQFSEPRAAWPREVRPPLA